MVWLHDALTLDAPRRSKDGYVAVRARAARTGVYDYLGAEVDPEGKRFKPDQVVKVYRPADEVFAPEALASFVMKPITDDHPTVAVNARNWRDHARGAIVGAVKDGDYIGFDLAFMDGATVDKLDSGKRELSNGYSCDLAFEDGQAPDGTAYQAVQRNIRGNHVALVGRGRAGPECRVIDAEPARFATCDANPEAVAGLFQEKAAMKIRIGDAEVDATNGEAVRIAVASLDAKLTAQETQIGTLTADLSTARTANDTKDGEIAALKAKLADAEITPERLQALADARAQVISKAKALAPSLTVDGKTDAEIRKAAVTAKLGDAAAAMSDAAIEGAFAALTVDAKSEQQQVTPIVTPVVANDHQVAFEDARSKRLERYATAYKNTPAVAS